jgi:hypothetical protein
MATLQEVVDAANGVSAVAAQIDANLDGVVVGMGVTPVQMDEVLAAIVKAHVPQQESLDKIAKLSQPLPL